MTNFDRIAQRLDLEKPSVPRYSLHDDLRDKVVLITGASSGIGAAAALAFGACGARVAVHFRSRRDEALELVARIKEAGGDAAAFQAEAADSASLDRLSADTVARFGRIDVLVNNAGGFVQRVPLADASDAIIDEVFHQNSRSMMALGRSVIPRMRAQGGGNIINVTSQAARSGAARARVSTRRPRASYRPTPARWPGNSLPIASG